MKRTLFLITLLLLANALLALGEVTQTAEPVSSDLDAETFYSSVTASAEFKDKLVFLPIGARKNDLFEDIKVSVVEAVPFAFFYTALVMSLQEALAQKKMLWEIDPAKFDPKTKEKFIYACAGFAAVNLAVNLTFYYADAPGKALDISLDPSVKAQNAK